MKRKTLAVIAATCALVAGLVAGTTHALTEPHGDSELSALAFRDPGLYISSVYTPASELSPAEAAGRLDALGVLGVAANHGYVDRRTGSWGTLLLSQPLVPGTGKGNALSWTDLGRPAPASSEQLEAAALAAFESYLALHQPQIALSPAELGERSVTAHGDGDLVQIVIGQSVAGVPVRGAFLSAVVSHGNLVLLGARNWGAVGVPTAASIDAAAALAAVESYAGRPADGQWREPRLELVPTSTGPDPSALALGTGLDHRLVWAVGASFNGDHGSWEGLVDAGNGELVAFLDANHYVKGVRGGVFPLSNDGRGGVEGNEQPGYPMPFADVRLDSGDVVFTDSGGDLVCQADGSSITSELSGRYVSIFDNCGAVSESAADPNDLDFGAGPGTDCQVPAGSSSAGNTHSARSGFYEVNRIQEIARSWLPDNAWLNSQLTANMNIDDTCNAFWNGSTINFYKSGGGCRNTGEIAAIFDHEWGHGMDDNDANPGISAPGEAYADVAAVLRLNSSCIGRGFESDDSNCGGNGDPCLDCSGVREVDWTKRDSGQPHDLDWINNPSVVGRGGCIDLFIPTQQGPCGFGTHCEGSVASEAIWDLLKRDLPAFAGAGFSFDDTTAQEFMHRTYYLAGGALGNWYNCNPAAPPGEHGDGCNADGAYLNFLALDDDNGDLTDGTPHMPAFFAAFDRHQLACSEPLPTAGATCTRPTAAPNVSAAPTNKGVELSWAAVPGASKYWIFRGDGALACEFGKARVGETTATSFTDAGIGHDLAHAYTVMAVGSSDSCVGPASPCLTVTPTPGADLIFTEQAPAVTAIAGGDGDPFVDNCETATVGFAVRNIGTVALSNVRVTHVEPLSHPGLTITDTPTFASSLAACGEASGSFEFIASGLGFNDDVVFRVDVTADELGGRVVSTTARLLAAESDFVLAASRTWSFDADREDWTVVQGTFDHNAGVGGAGSLGYLESSAFQDDRCDEIRSPILRLTDDSTLSLYNQFSIEPGDPNVLGFYDRANVGVRDLADGSRTPVSPDAGRLYNASGPNGACVTAGQQGWAGAGVPFDESTWSSAALNPGGAFTGKLVVLDVAYGTDPAASLGGFQFDEVTLTDFEEQVADTQTDVCPVTPPPPPCGEVDDDDDAIDYRRGWHRKQHAAASNGNYHRRMGKANNGTEPTARLTFSGDSVTYHYAMSEIGGVGDVYIDGVFQESISYGNGGNGPDQPTFGHSRTWSGLGAGSHTLVVEHVTGTVYVDGFSFDCADSSASADASAAEFGSATETLTVPASEGPIVLRTLDVGADDTHLSVAVEGSTAPVTVELLDPLGLTLGTGGALLTGGTVSGVDADVAAPGLYTLRVTRPLGSSGALEVSVARTHELP